MVNPRCLNCGYPKASLEVCSECGGSSFSTVPGWWRRLAASSFLLGRVSAIGASASIGIWILTSAPPETQSPLPFWSLFMLLLLCGVAFASLASLAIVWTWKRDYRPWYPSISWKPWLIPALGFPVAIAIMSMQIHAKAYAWFYSDDIESIVSYAQNELSLGGTMEISRSVGWVPVSKIVVCPDGSIWMFCGAPSFRPRTRGWVKSVSRTSLPNSVTCGISVEVNYQHITCSLYEFSLR